MTVLSVILGILLAISGVSFMCTPLATFLSAGYFFVILMLVYGILGIVKAVSDKEYGVNFLFAIITTILGLIVLFVPELRVLTDGVLLYLVAAWFVVQGLVSIFLALNAKRISTSKLWICGIVLGIIGVILGIYSFIRPLVLAVAIGVFIGAYFFITGINMIVLALQNNK